MWCIIIDSFFFPERKTNFEINKLSDSQYLADSWFSVFHTLISTLSFFSVYSFYWQSPTNKQTNEQLVFIWTGISRHPSPSPLIWPALHLHRLDATPACLYRTCYVTMSVLAIQLRFLIPTTQQYYPPPFTTIHSHLRRIPTSTPTRCPTTVQVQPCLLRLHRLPLYPSPSLLLQFRIPHQAPPNRRRKPVMSAHVGLLRTVALCSPYPALEPSHPLWRPAIFMWNILTFKSNPSPDHPAVVHGEPMKTVCYESSYKGLAPATGARSQRSCHTGPVSKPARGGSINWIQAWRRRTGHLQTIA